MKRRDFLILAIVLVASLTLLLLRPQTIENTAETSYLRISLAGQTEELVPLDRKPGNPNRSGQRQL